jgi:hypothetical protein
MKRIFLVFAILVLMAGNAFATASSIVAATDTIGGVKFASPDGTMILLKLTCTADSTDGTFVSTALSSSVITYKTKFGTWYYDSGYVLAHAWVVNSATDDHTNASVVTITDATGQVIVGAAVGDTLTLSTAASGIAYLVVDRGSAQRAVTSALTIAIADTGSTATVQTIYLLLQRK